MDSINKGDIVEAVSGRDSGHLFFVLLEEDEFLILADGKHRRIEQPKRKKRKHVRYEATHPSRVTSKLMAAEKITNSELRSTLAQYVKSRDNPDDQTTDGG